MERRKSLILVALFIPALYTFMFPVDLISDFIPFIGYLDDVAAVIVILKNAAMAGQKLLSKA